MLLTGRLSVVCTGKDDASIQSKDAQFVHKQVGIGPDTLSTEALFQQERLQADVNSLVTTGSYGDAFVQGTDNSPLYNLAPSREEERGMGNFNTKELTCSQRENIDAEKQAEHINRMNYIRHFEAKIAELEMSMPPKKQPAQLAYLSLIAEANNQYDAFYRGIDEATLRGSVFEFQEYGGWTPMKRMEEVEKELEKLFAGTEHVVEYTIGIHVYEVKLAYDDPSTAFQRNKTTASTRRIRQTSATHIDEPSRLHLAKAHAVLFGTDAPMQLRVDFLDRMIKEYEYGYDEKGNIDVPCVELAKLAELFSSFATEYKYYDPSKKESECKTRLAVNPIKLVQWLITAKHKGYKSVRLVCHGSNKEGYDNIMKDPDGMSLDNSGKANGSVHGPGIYLSKSDHTVKHYNKEHKEGTMLLCLILTDDSMVEETGRYKNFKLFPPQDLSDPGMQNCIMIRELPLILVLGVAEAI